MWPSISSSGSGPDDYRSSSMMPTGEIDLLMVIHTQYNYCFSFRNFLAFQHTCFKKSHSTAYQLEAGSSNIDK